MNKKTMIIVAVVVVVVLAVVAFFAMGNHGTSAPQAQSPSQQQPAQTGTNNQAQPMQPAAAAPAGSYTSSADGFSADFQGTPDVTKSTFNSLTAGSIPLTKYIAQSGSGSSAKYYVLNVYHYPQSYQFPGNYLTGALQLFAIAVAAKYPGAKLTSQTPTQFQGNAAMAGVLSVPIGGVQTTGYVLITVRGQNTYGMGTYNASEDDYNTFVNSFAFTQ